jgi:hypothetical protein
MRSSVASGIMDDAGLNALSMILKDHAGLDTLSMIRNGSCLGEPPREIQAKPGAAGRRGHSSADARSPSPRRPDRTPDPQRLAPCWRRARFCVCVMYDLRRRRSRRRSGRAGCGGRGRDESAAPPAEIAVTSVRSLQRELARAGLSYSDLLDQVRFERGAELLQTTDAKIVEIALACGYTDAAHFARAFRRMAGVTPRQFREQSL